MKYNDLIYTVRSVIGNRDEQQDAAATVEDGADFLAVVCDGMGGLNNGSLASSSTVNKLCELFKTRNRAEKIQDFFLYSVDILDEQVVSFRDNEGDPLHAGTTIVAVNVKGNELHWLSVGDSRLYLLRGSEIVQATRDHNYYLQLESMKNLIGDEFSPTQEDVAKGNALISFIGIGGIETMDISTNAVQLYPGDVILLSSDGLFKVLSDAQIQFLIRENADLEQAADALLAAAEQAAPATRDNITFIIIQVDQPHE